MRTVTRFAFNRVRWIRLHDRGIKPGRVRRSGGHSRFLVAGQVVRESGIYEVLHDREHRPSHDVLMYRDQVFPACDQCGKKVRFKVVRTAPYIFDADFV